MSEPLIRDKVPSRDFLAGGGEMGARMRRHDWAASPLGAPEGWPAPLQVVLRILLTSRYAMWMAYGPSLTFFCNDAYLPTLGVKQGWALGAPATKVWAEIWKDIGPRIDHVLATGEATWDEGLLLFLGRSGVLEETYHTFSYSPVPGEAGAIAGMLCVVTEETERVVGTRRLASLRELGAALTEAKTRPETCRAIERSLGANPHDLPFTLTYVFDESGRTAELACSTGFAPDHPMAARAVAVGDAAAPWPLDEAGPVATTLPLAGPDLPRGAWDRPPREAEMIPLARPGDSRPAGFLVVGVNPYRPHDAAARDFLGLLGGQIASALANVDAYEAERRRAEALTELDRTKTQFFSNVSHEFRTPLTLMLGPLEDALAQPEGTLAASHRESLELVHRNALRLLKLVNSLLDFSRIEAGRMAANLEPIDLAALTADLASTFRAAIERAGLALTVDCPPLGEPVLVDREMWETVVLNLLSNAVKFTFAGGIHVAVRRRGGVAELSVRDTGTGIPAHELPRLFERFHRVEGARGRSFEGSGIGLALVQELLRLHRGTLRVESELGRGSTFVAAVPAVAAPADAPADRLANARAARPASTDAASSRRTAAFAEEASHWLLEGAGLAPPEIVPDRLPEAPARGASVGGGARLLLADDNADMREYVRRLLVGRGYLVDAHADGAAALAAARASRPELVLSDVMMPGLDGFGLLRALREDPSLRDVPVILLSARAGQESTLEGLDAGADDYLVKPFAARELLARVATHVAMARLRREAAVIAGLRAAELEAVLEAVPVALWFTRDPEARTVHGNPSAARLLRVSRERNHSLAAPESELATHYRVLRDGAPAPVDSLPLHRAARGEAVEADELEIRFEGGDSVFVVCRAVPVLSPAGAPAGAVCAATDITERKRAEQALRMSHGVLERTVERRTRDLRRIFELSPDLFATVGLDGALQAVSPAWTGVLGHDEAALLRRPLAALIHPDDRPALAAAIEGLRGGAAGARFESRVRGRDGDDRWFAWSVVGDGGLLYAVGRDTTAEKRTLDELAGANRQLLAQIEERERVEATLRQLQRLDAIGQLTSGVAHDFNNLLTVVLGNVDALAASPAAADARFARRVEMIRGAATRGAKLTAQLLAFSRRQKLEARPVDLNEAVAGMKELLRTTVGSAVRIETRLDDALPPALVDATQLELVILNLAINARDAMPAGGTLAIETGAARLGPPGSAEEPPAGDYLTIAVADTGTGMTEAVRARAFEPFFTTKEVGKGSGLGLAQVYGFAKQSGGGLRIDTRPGAGTTVRVFLPPADRDAVLVGGAARAATPPAAEAAATVLVVDDDAAVREVAAMMLEERGYRVLAADGGLAALTLLEREPAVGVLLVDYAMPGMNGLEVAERAAGCRPDLPVLFMTGYVDPTVLRAVPEHRIVRKPFLDADLAGKLAAALEPAAPATVG